MPLTYLSYLFTPVSGGTITSTEALLQVIIIVFSLTISFFSITRLRINHSALIYTLWYIYSLTFCIGLVIGYLNPQQIGVKDAQTSPLVMDAYVLLTSIFNIRDDLALVLFLVFITIAPQLITYVVSGLFGCAAAPRYVSIVVKYCVFSVVKTTIGFSGFTTGFFLAFILSVHATVFFDTITLSNTPLMIFTEAFWTVGCPFVILYLYYVGGHTM
jgi:hypothetical protein